MHEHLTEQAILDCITQEQGSQFVTENQRAISDAVRGAISIVQQRGIPAFDAWHDLFVQLRQYDLADHAIIDKSWHLLRPAQQAAWNRRKASIARETHIELTVFRTVHALITSALPT